jgi:DNA-binding response OmpR family regulator
MQHKEELLVVDDNPENLHLLATVLEKEGYVVRAAKNGKQALTGIKKKAPDLLILDIHMPEMDGFELCKIIKSKQKYKYLPVIFISALSDSFNKLKGFEAGAIDYLTKPFDLDEVKMRVKNHLQLRNSLSQIDKLQAKLARKDKEIKQLKQKLEEGT